jgi:hypothetical protein
MAFIPWSTLQLLRLGDDYVLLMRREGKLAWFLSLPRQFFASEADWCDMEEFVQRRLMRPYMAPRCVRCKKRFSRSELRPMPWGLRLLVGNVFTVLGYWLGVPAAGYCSDCWSTAYSRQLATLIFLVLLFMGIIGAIAYLTWV